MSYSFRSCPVLQGSFLRHAAYLRHRLHLLSFHLHSGWISALQLQAVHARLRPPSQLLLFPSAPLIQGFWTDLLPPAGSKERHWRSDSRLLCCPYRMDWKFHRNFLRFRFLSEFHLLQGHPDFHPVSTGPMMHHFPFRSGYPGLYRPGLYLSLIHI